jgi:hypothetical protein
MIILLLFLIAAFILFFPGSDGADERGDAAGNASAAPASVLDTAYAYV